MPARTARQLPENRELFRQLIRAKVAREKSYLQARANGELPSWAAWAMKPIVSVLFDIETAGDNIKGKVGEIGTLMNVRLLLPDVWTMLNDVVLEPKPDEFIQLDHMLVGPPGVFLIETKAWEGAFLAHRDNWKRKEGNRWVRCDSPTRQSLRHLKLFTLWITETLGDAVPADPSKWIYPNVVFTRAKWLKIEGCSVPVFDDSLRLGWHLRRQTRTEVLNPVLVDRIVQSIVNAGPCERKDVMSMSESTAGTKEAASTVPDTTDPTRELQQERAVGSTAQASTSVSTALAEQGRTRQGRPFVKVRGSHEDALRIYGEYKQRGRQPTTVKADKYERDAWYFYLRG